VCGEGRLGVSAQTATDKMEENVKMALVWTPPPLLSKRRVLTRYTDDHCDVIERSLIKCLRT